MSYRKEFKEILKNKTADRIASGIHKTEGRAKNAAYIDATVEMNARHGERWKLNNRLKGCNQNSDPHSEYWANETQCK